VAGPRRPAGPPRRRWAAPAALLIFVSLVTASALALGSLPHGGLLVLALLLVVLPVMLLATLAGALIWVGRRAWRSGAWLEALPLAVGMPWLGRVVWALRAALVGRAFWRMGQRVRRPWRQPRTGDLSGTTR
jgi:hypothetical protein